MVARKKKSNEPINHSLIPEHKKLNEREKKILLDKHDISVHELPKILASDPALRGKGVEPDDVIKVTRESPTAGTSVSYRGVVNG